MYLKVLTDQECNLYVDDDFVCLIPSGELTKVPFEKGEYVIRFECTSLPELFIERDIFLEYDKVERIFFNQEILRQTDIIANQILIPFKNVDGLWGYQLENTSLWAIPPIYEGAEKFDDYRQQFAIVSKGGTSAVINRRGEIIIPLGVYSSINYDAHRRLFVGIDHKGAHWAISEIGVQVDEITDTGIDSLQGYNDFICQKVFDCDCDRARWRGLSLDGRVIEELGIFDFVLEAYRNIYSHVYPCSLYFIIDKDNKYDSYNPIWGVVLVSHFTKTVKWIRPCSLYNEDLIQYSERQVYYENKDRYSFSCFYDYNDDHLYYYYYYPYLGIIIQKKSVSPYNRDKEETMFDETVFDQSGRILFEKNNFEGLSSFIDGFASFSIDDKEYYLSSKGVIIGPFCFIGGFFNDYAEIRIAGKYGLIDEGGSLVIPCEYEYLDWKERYDAYNLAEEFGITPNYSLNVLVKKGGKYGMFSLKNKTILIPISYEQILYKELGYCCETSNGWDIYNNSGALLDTGLKDCPEDNNIEE